MTIYWFTFLVPSFWAAFRLRLSPAVKFWLWIVWAFFLTLIIGLRYRVGGDWGTYSVHFWRTATTPYWEIITSRDPAYYLINRIASDFGADIWLVNLVCAAIFISGLSRFIHRLPEPLIALAAATPYMIIVVSMGYTRQAAALGMVMWALPYLIDRRFVAFSCTVGVATFFHTSAVALLPLAVLTQTRRRTLTAIWATIWGVLMYLLYLDELLGGWWDNYVESDYAFASEGGIIRVAMSAVPAVIFLSLYKFFPMARQEKAMWFWIASITLALMSLVFQSPTAVDRLSLYFITIQLAVWSYLPGLFAPSFRLLIRLLILGFYGLVLFWWLNYATHAEVWIPYQFWPLADVGKTL